MKKSFILDTNVILSSGTSGGSKVLSGFLGGKDANDITIPGTVLQELDKFKSDPGEVGYNARDFIRTIDNLRLKGNLLKGVSLQRGKVIVEPDGVKSEYLPVGFDINVPDNRIISTCIHLAKTHPKTHYVFISNDVSCRINADVCFRAAEVSISIESYKNDIIISQNDKEYMGYVTWDPADKSLIDRLYKDDYVETELTKDLYEEEFVILRNGSSSAIAIYEDNMLRLIREPNVFGINKLLNAEQVMAMYALLAPPEKIPLVVLTGSAGTGKTFLATAAGIDRTYGCRNDSQYDRIILTRSNQLNKEENMGYLPGDVQDKMNPLIQPVRDSIENLLRSKNGGEKEDNEEIQKQIDDIFLTCIDILPMLYVRGRSLTRKYLILDEAQSITPQQSILYLSRAAAGTKVVLCGDIHQTESATMDQYTCGLSYVWEKMRGKGVAMVRFSDNEVVRSYLSKIVQERMGNQQ